MTYPTFTKRGGPDLQKLVEAFCGYDKIPDEAWTRWDKQTKWYREFTLAGGHHGEAEFWRLCETASPERRKRSARNR